MAHIKGTKDQLCIEALSLENEIEALIESKSDLNTSTQVTDKFKAQAINDRIKFLRKRLTALKSELKRRKMAQESLTAHDDIPHFDNEGLLSSNIFSKSTK
jgi:hypothetical protein